MVRAGRVQISPSWFDIHLQSLNLFLNVVVVRRPEVRNRADGFSLSLSFFWILSFPFKWQNKAIFDIRPEKHEHLGDAEKQNTV